MADISSIKMPNGSIYDLKDKNAQTKINVSGILEGDGQGGISESDILDYDTDTTSGSVVSFTADGVAPLKALTLSIDPVQDLHGYDAPWPAGGGKNKFDPQYFTGDVDTIYLNFHGARNVATAHGTHVKANTTYTCTIQLPATPSASWGIYGCYANDSTTVITFSANGIDNPRTFSFTPTEDTDVIMWAYMSGSGNTWSNQGVTSIDNVRVQIEQGSTATTYAPYSNICPISGWTEANVWRTGRNLLALTPCWRMNYNPTVGAVDNIVSPIDTTWTDNGDGTFSLASLGSWASAGFLTPLLPAGTYTYHIEFVTGSTVRKSINVYDANYVAVSKSTSQPAGAVSETRTITLTEPGYIGIGLYGYGEAVTIKEPGVYVGATYSSYAPYTGNQFTIQLGQTVYGGTLDVTNGVLTVDRAMASARKVHFSSKITGSVMDYRQAGSFPPTASIVDWNKARQQQISNMAKIANPNSESNYGNYVAVVYTLAADTSAGSLRISEDLYQSMSDDDTIEVVYKLLNPITIPLTPQEISTLAGQNVLWADSGAVSLEYRKGENALLQDISEAIKNLQGKIRVSGLLKGDGNGNVTAAINGTDYSKVIIRDWSVT